MFNMRELKAKLSLDARQFEAGIARAGQGLDRLAGHAASAGGGMAVLNLAAASMAIGGLAALGQRVGETVWELGELGARSIDVSRNLTAFAGGADEAARYVAAVTEASDNSVDRMTAAATASRFLQMGLADTTSEMALYVQGAVRLGDQTLSAGQRIGEMTQLLKNLNVNMLDNFGLSRAVVMARTEELQAVQGLSREEAMLLSIQEEISRQLGVLGERSEEGAVSIDQMQSSITNLKLSIAEGLAPVVVQAAGLLYNLSEAIQGNTKGLAEFLLARQVALEEAGMNDPLYKWLTNWALAEAGMERATNVHGEWTLGLQSGAPAMAAAEKDVGDLAEGYYGLATAIWTASGAKRSASDIYEYRRDNLTSQTQTNDLDLIKEVNAEIPRIIATSAQEAEQAWDGFFSSQEQQWDNLRGTIRSALQPTSVTPLDMGLSESGQYVDKWDENARRLSAVAERGFAELQQHADWAAILKIPPEVLSAGEEALKDWANRTAGAVRNLERPDLLNLDAALDAVQAELNRQAAQELTLDIVAKAAVERGIVAGDDAKAQVARALGLEEDPGLAGLFKDALGAEGMEAVKLPVQFMPVNEEGEESGQTMGDAGMAMARQVSAAFLASIQEIGVATSVQAAILDDVSKNAEALNNAGQRIWVAVEPGIRTALKKTPWVKEFARHMAPYVADVLENRGWR